MKLKISDIKIGDRFRKDMGDIESLKFSLKERGQIQPIVVDRANNLIAGHRRITAAVGIGWLEIEGVYRDEVDPLTARELELEENIVRAAFTDAEEVAAVLEIHKLKQLKNPEGWGIRETAQSLGFSKSKAHRIIQVAEASLKYVDVAETLLKSGTIEAHKVLIRKEEDKVNALIAQHYKNKAEEALKEGGAAQAGGEGRRRAEEVYQRGDARELVRGLADKSINLVFTDPPYGISVENMNWFGGNTTNYKYEDGPEATDSLMASILPELYRVLVDDSFIFLWVAFKRFGETKLMMEKAGFEVCAVPFVWVKDTAQAKSPNEDRWFKPTVEYGIYGWKGKPSFAIKYQNAHIVAAPCPIRDRAHPHEKPVDLQRQLLRRFIVAGQKVLDPFSGSGSVVKAALAENMQVLGFEKDETYYAQAYVEIGELLGQNKGDLTGLGYDEAQIRKMSDETKRTILDKKLSAEHVSVLPDGSFVEMQ